MPENNTRIYSNLTDGEYWELFRGYDLDTAEEYWEPIGYTYAGLNFTDDGLDEMEANPSDSGVIQTDYGKSNPGVEFTAMTAFHDPDSDDDTPRVKMGLIDEYGNGVNHAQWEAAAFVIYGDDPRVGGSVPEPQEVAVCHAFMLKSDDIDYPDDGKGEINIESSLNAHPNWPLQVGEEPPDLYTDMATDGGVETTESDGDLEA